MKNTRPVLSLLVLLLFFFIGDRMIGYVFNYLFMRSNFRYATIYKSEGLNYDVLIFGNSRGRSYYAPYMEEKLGLTCYNLSYNRLRIPFINLVFNDYLEKNVPPKLIIVEIHSLMGYLDGHLSVIKIFYDMSERMRKHLATYNHKEWQLSRLSRVYRYNGEFLIRALLSGKSDQYWMIQGKASQAVIESVLSKKDRKLNPPSGRALQEAKAFMETANAYGCEVRFVYNPNMPGFYQEGIVDKYIASLQKTTGKVWDYSDLFQDFTLFRDDLHINIEGCYELIDQQIADGFYFPFFEQREEQNGE
ncbi:MAG: hypothetical protein K8S56_05110 [Candidatus Cloacimonetes bacterium]|nr:hypothetical protein [Candidatus Cloacimonadota bacterium]